MGGLRFEDPNFDHAHGGDAKTYFLMIGTICRPTNDPSGPKPLELMKNFFSFDSTFKILILNGCIILAVVISVNL